MGLDLVPNSTTFLAFLDDDDTWEPKKMIIQLTFMDRMDIQLGGTNALKMDADQPYFLPLSTRIFKFSDFLKQNELVTSSVVVSRELFYAGNAFPAIKPSGEDYVLWLKIHFGGTKSCRLAECLVNYQDSGISLSRQLNENGSQQKLRILRAFREDSHLGFFRKFARINSYRLMFEIRAEAKKNAKN